MRSTDGAGRGVAVGAGGVVGAGALVAADAVVAAGAVVGAGASIVLTARPPAAHGALPAGGPAVAVALADAAGAFALGDEGVQLATKSKAAARLAEARRHMARPSRLCVVRGARTGSLARRAQTVGLTIIRKTIPTTRTVTRIPNERPRRAAARNAGLAGPSASKTRSCAAKFGLMTPKATIATMR